MSKHLGDFDASTVVYGKFTTYRPSTGAAYTLAGTPALSVYKDNSTTQSTTGVTLTADFDAVTGLNHFAIDTSADGTFYAAGSFFDIVITTGTVDSVSVVGAVVGSFTIRKNSALKPATAGRTLVVDAAGLADANMVKLGPTGSGTAQTARDIGASVLLSSGTGTGQVTLTSGRVNADMTHIATAAVSASTAQLGVNVVNFGGSAGTFAGGIPAVNTTQLAGTAQTGRDIGASVLLSSGTGTGQVSLSGGAVKIQTGLKKAQALSNFPFLMTDSTNHNPLTGLTVTATRSLDGAAFASGTIANMTEVSNGIYQCDLLTGDTNGDTVVLRFTAPGADDLFVTLITEP